jgi:hypothetical protein
LNRVPRRGLLLRGPVPGAAALVLLSACGSLPLPPTGPVPADAPALEVAYPPPPARVEVVPPRPHDGDVWVGGQWEWASPTWRWLPGAWMSPPPGAYFTPWSVVRRPDGRLLFTAATWRDPDGRALELGPGQPVCEGPPVRLDEAR